MILSGNSNVSLNCEMAEKRLNLQDTHFLGVALIVQQYVTTNLLNVEIFGIIWTMTAQNLLFNLF
jgi:hypothetical protein